MAAGFRSTPQELVLVVSAKYGSCMAVSVRAVCTLALPHNALSTHASLPQQAALADWLFLNVALKRCSSGHSFILSRLVVYLQLGKVSQSLSHYRMTSKINHSLI